MNRSFKDDGCSPKSCSNNVIDYLDLILSWPKGEEQQMPYLKMGYKSILSSFAMKYWLLMNISLCSFSPFMLCLSFNPYFKVSWLEAMQKVAEEILATICARKLECSFADSANSLEVSRDSRE
jgi:hypothetical protein